MTVRKNNVFCRDSGTFPAANKNWSAMENTF